MGWQSNLNGPASERSRETRDLAGGRFPACENKGRIGTQKHAVPRSGFVLGCNLQRSLYQ